MLKEDIPETGDALSIVELNVQTEHGNEVDNEFHQNGDFDQIIGYHEKFVKTII